MSFLQCQLPAFAIGSSEQSQSMSSLALKGKELKSFKNLKPNYVHTTYGLVLLVHVPLGKVHLPLGKVVFK